jgi:hypothetical protein
LAERKTVKTFKYTIATLKELYNHFYSLGYMMDGNPHTSELLYMGLCDTIGTPTEVTIRRDVCDMGRLLRDPVDTYISKRALLVSGSYREGFRFESSDTDTMCWMRHMKVITDIAQAGLYDRTKHSIILMENNDTPPGFVKLKYLTMRELQNCELNMYIPAFVHQLVAFEETNNNMMYYNVTRHGPCANFYCGGQEFDLCICLAAVHWPDIALPWIERCMQSV